MRKPIFSFLTWSNTNQAEQSQKMARGLNFWIQKVEDHCTIYVAKTKALISFTMIGKLICVFVFAYAKRWFSHEAAQIYIRLIIHLTLTLFICQRCHFIFDQRSNFI